MRTDDHKGVFTLSHAETVTIKFVFTQFQYIFTKLGRIVNSLTKLKNGWKGFQLKLEMSGDTASQPTSKTTKLPPHVMRIIEQQRKDPTSKKATVACFKTF